MTKRDAARSIAALAAGASLLAAACGSREGGDAPLLDPRAEAAWMDEAVLRVEQEPCREVLYLVDPASGTQVVLDVDESKRTQVCAAPPVARAAAALAHRER